MGLTAMERAARVSALLDEAKDELATITREPRVRIVIAVDKITEAQNVLMGEQPPDPRMN